MPNEWVDPLNKAYQGRFDRLAQEFARLKAASHYARWSTGTESSSIADQGNMEADKAYLDALQQMESSKARESLSWMKYDQDIARKEAERIRREKAAKSAGWWKLGGTVAGLALGAIPGGGFFSKVAQGAGRVLTGLPGQAFGGGEEDGQPQEPGVPGSLSYVPIQEWQKQQDLLRQRYGKSAPDRWADPQRYIKGFQPAVEISEKDWMKPWKARR